MGKTTVAEKLCSLYQIHHIKVREVIEDKIAQLVGESKFSSFSHCCLKEIYCPLVEVNAHCLFLLQKEIVNEADPVYVSEKAAAAAQKRLDNLNKNMEMNAG